MILRARDLARKSPPAAWEAYFLIGVFSVSSALRWCKVQLYSGCARHSLAAVEGMNRTPQRLIVGATRDEIFRDEQPLGFTASEDGFEIGAGELWWKGFPASRLQTPHLSARVDARDPFAWSSIPGVLTYWTAFGSGSFETPLGSGDGAALVEHAWGMGSRLDLARLGPRRWQWDVLRFEDGSTCAGLSVYGVPAGRSGGHAPGSAFSTGLGLRVSSLERDGDGFPVRWRGSLHLHAGTVAYEAHASTAVARDVPGGGFFGFEFRGTHRGRAVGGTGFTEFRAR